MSCCGEKGTVAWVAHGALGLAKAVLGIAAADEKVRAQRTAICQACPHSAKHPTKRSANGLPLVRFCEMCGCLLAAKIRVATERCCAGKWGEQEKLK
jgi:hypothetical protein